MGNKIAFMGDVPAHGNIVRFIGEVDDGTGEGSVKFFLSLSDISLRRYSRLQPIMLAVGILFTST